MAKSGRNENRGDNRYQQPASAPPAPPQPQQAPVAPVQPPTVPPVAPPPAPPAPRPATPRTAVELAAIRLVGRSEEMLEEAERRDNARRIELEEAERRRQAFWRVVRMVVGIIVLVGIAVMVTMLIMATPTPIFPASPPSPVVITTSQAPTPANINIICGCDDDELCVPCTTEECLQGNKVVTVSSAKACCRAIPDEKEERRCLDMVDILKRR